MRAKEFITEGKNISPYTEKQLANIMVIPELDQYYEFYRFMIAAAMAPDSSPNGTPDLANRPTAYAYTKHDEEKLKSALRHMNKKGKWLASGEAAEPSATNTVSPVAVKKKNKYGV